MKYSAPATKPHTPCPSTFGILLHLASLHPTHYRSSRCSFWRGEPESSSPQGVALFLLFEPCLAGAYPAWPCVATINIFAELIRRPKFNIFAELIRRPKFGLQPRQFTEPELEFKK